MQRSGINYRCCILIGTKYNHQVTDHRGFLFLIKIDDLFLTKLLYAAHQFDKRSTLEPTSS